MASRSARTRKRGGRTRRSNPVLLTRAVLCRVAGVSERELSLWEHEELISPARISEVGGRPEPLYASDALERARVIRALAEDLDVNLPGIGVILHLLDQLDR
jgi:DNA-binding transcriptional MerR regulator